MSNSNSWKHCLEYAVISDVGLRRANNQDSYAVLLAGTQQDFDERGHLFMVADGMGAHAAGELASKIAIDVVPLTYHKLREKSPPDALLAAVIDSNDSNPQSRFFESRLQRHGHHGHDDGPLARRSDSRARGR